MQVLLRESMADLQALWPKSGDGTPSPMSHITTSRLSWIGHPLIGEGVRCTVFAQSTWHGAISPGF